MELTNSQHHIECEFHAASGMIERLLRVIRVRGFHVNNMQLHYGDEIYKARLALSGERAVHNLKAHLEKLAGIISIEILSQQVSGGAVLEICA